jgi:hypothetical protein
MNIRGLAALLIAATLWGSAASAAPCPRECLIATIQGYLDALVRHDPSTVRWAASARLTENGAVVHAGGGLWSTADRIGDYRLLLADVDSQQAAFVGVIHRGKAASLVSIRVLRKPDGIKQVETIVGPDRFPGSLGRDPHSLEGFRTSFDTLLPRAQRRSPAELRAIAASYYAGVNGAEPQTVPFTTTGNRVEVGTQITGNPQFRFEFYAQREGQSLPNFAAWSPGEQFQRGLWNSDTVTHVRPALIDAARGLVLAYAVYNPWGKRECTSVRDVGEVCPAQRGTRLSLHMMELFKIIDGRIDDMESVWTVQPPGGTMGW